MSGYKYHPTLEEIEYHRACKAQYLAAKMGLIYLCGNCRQEIYYPQKKGIIQDCAMPQWLHVNEHGVYDYGRLPCYNDESDGTAWPMTEIELQDFHEDIMKDEWYYEDSSKTNNNE